MIHESYNVTEESELVKASPDGDKNAFGEIVNRYHKMVARREEMIRHNRKNH